MNAVTMIDEMIIEWAKAEGVNIAGRDKQSHARRIPLVMRISKHLSAREIELERAGVDFRTTRQAKMLRGKGEPIPHDKPRHEQ